MSSEHERDCGGDGRRELGEQTRQRLLDATRALVAERGEDAVTLRAITARAEANVSAVSYHFGSKDVLVRTAIEQAVRSVLTAQMSGLRALPPVPAVTDIARAFASPVLHAVTSGYPQDHVLLRIAARSIDPHRTGDAWLDALKADAQAALVRALQHALPAVTPDELAFRGECAVAILIFLASMDAAHLQELGPDRLEAMATAALAGAMGAAAGVAST